MSRHRILRALAACSFLAALCSPAAAFDDQLTPLPPGAVRLKGYLDDYLQASANKWNKGVVPYAGFVQMFRTGRGKFAQGEMWGKAVRSGCMFYRYTQDPELRQILRQTVADMLTTVRSNGCISCSDIAHQPDGPGGDLWERKYVLLGLDEYYRQVEKDPLVLKAMMNLADCTIAQVGPAPKTRIIDSGWSPNHIESSTILEPVMRLYQWTKQPRYLEFAHYIVEVEGGAKGYPIIEDAFRNRDPEQIGGPYPKAYEMLSLFEGLLEYYRATGNDRWKTAALNLYRNVREKEITLIGNGGGDQPYHPAVRGEAWDYTALEQTNPKMNRMMETCTGVTWLKFCGQVLRLTANPSAVDEIEKYAYNGLIGAMKPAGDGFSYVNLLNGVKTNPVGWGGIVNGVNVTCCNLNGPMGLAQLPMIAVMNSATGPVINLFNAASVTASTPAGRPLNLAIDGDYPKTGAVAIQVRLQAPEKFSIRIRIPAWSLATRLSVNGKVVRVTPGSYADIQRTWSSGDKIALQLDLRCRVLNAPHGSDRAGDHFQALIRGPVVLARDEAIDRDYNQPVRILAKNGYAHAVPVPPTLKSTRMQFRVATDSGSIQVVDYASVDNWTGRHICTWLPRP
jgi:DUF1680 family protein